MPKRLNGAQSGGYLQVALRPSPWSTPGWSAIRVRNHQIDACQTLVLLTRIGPTLSRKVLRQVCACRETTGRVALQGCKRHREGAGRGGGKRPGRDSPNDRAVDQGQPARGTAGTGAPVQGAVRLPGTQRRAPGEDRTVAGGSGHRDAALPEGSEAR